MGIFRRKISEKETLKKIKDSQYALIFAPFHGEPVPVLVRELTQAQVMACGTFSAIETFQDKIDKQSLVSGKSLGAVLDYAEKQHEICRRALVNPTYDQIIEEITDSSIEEARVELKELKASLRETPKGPERTELEDEIDRRIVLTDFILPEDFTATIVAYSLGIDKSDIKEISEEALLQAAILATRGHNNPADHLTGRFSEWMKDDINARAWMIYDKEKKQVKNGHR